MRTPGLMTVAVALVPMTVAGLLLWVLFFGAQPAEAACTATAGTVDVDAIPANASAGGFDRAQLSNAALIVNAAAAEGLNGSAPLLGVQTAIGESSLVDLDHGDRAINPDGTASDSLGLFQQQSSWGTVAERMDPTTAATAFFTRLKTVEGWQQMPPTLAINSVQGNADPNYYAPFAARAQAVVAYLNALATPPSSPASSTAPAATAGTNAARSVGAVGSCAALAGNARQLAESLMRQIEAGRLTLLQAEYEKEIADVAAGTQSADCGLDPRTLQIITIALKTFPTVGVSDLNRKCTGSLLGAGTQSAHWINGGGEAVDFYAFDGSALTGGDADSMRFLRVLGPIVPAGTRAGQIECRAATGFVHITQFDDTCDHLHVDVAYTNGAPLTLTG